MRLINDKHVREELLRRADSGPNVTRSNVWKGVAGKPPLYTRVSAAVLDEINSRVGVMLAEIVARNPAGKKGQTLK